MNIIVKRFLVIVFAVLISFHTKDVFLKEDMKKIIICYKFTYSNFEKLFLYFKDSRVKIYELLLSILYKDLLYSTIKNIYDFFYFIESFLNSTFKRLFYSLSFSIYVYQYVFSIKCDKTALLYNVFRAIKTISKTISVLLDITYYDKKQYKPSI